MITAEEARKLAGVFPDVEQGDSPEDTLTAREITKQIMLDLWEIVKEEASPPKRHRSAMVEPFSEIPGRYHSIEIEDEVMKGVKESLVAAGYRHITVERIDQRVVLRFVW